MKYWKRLPREECVTIIENALKENVDFTGQVTLGYPASRLDSKVFASDAPFLKDAPTLQTFVANPNHIGCHTLEKSESAFRGTHEIERDALRMLAVDVFKASPEEFDGYVATGGTEANMQAVWVYRNYFLYQKKAALSQIALLASEDTHYSIAKASNVFMLDKITVPVDEFSRCIDRDTLRSLLQKAKADGKKYFIVFANMGTTMFGSVDDPALLTSVLRELDLEFKLHVDGAYGGFVYPFTTDVSSLSFANPDVSSITIDAHKMLQAPYGTGIFLCRKGLIGAALTQEAQYVEGMDVTLCGSRSGANAIAIWMILRTYGPNGWFEKIAVLQMRTAWLCSRLDALGIRYFREPSMNIVTLRSEGISKHIAEKFDLVPETHTAENKWYKIVLMDHVEVEDLSEFLEALEEELYIEN